MGTHHAGIEHAGTERRRGDVHKLFLPAIRVMTILEISAYLVVGTTLIAMTGALLFRGGNDVYDIILTYHNGSAGAAGPIIDALGNILFTIILLELMATVITHIRHETFQVRPFVIIGIVSGVRQILLVGARLSLATNIGDSEWRRAQIELGVNVGIVLFLVIGLILLRRYKAEAETSEH